MPERTLASREFRLQYARLTEPVTVTALGRPIGRWVPVNAAIDGRVVAGIRPGEPVSHSGIAPIGEQPGGSKAEP